MPQQWRLDLYRRSCAGATPEQMQREFGLPADEIALRVEAARLCFEKQCLVAGVEMGEELKRPAAPPGHRARETTRPTAHGWER